MTIFRLTGAVSEVGVRRGVAKQSNEPYEIPYAVVQVDRFVRTSVNLPEGMVPKLREGDVVDLVCEVGVSGRYLNAQAVDSWPEDVPAAGQHLHAAAL